VKKKMGWNASASKGTYRYNRGRRSPVKMKAESVGKKDGRENSGESDQEDDRVRRFHDSSLSKPGILFEIGFVERVSVGVKTSSDLVCTGW